MSKIKVITIDDNKEELDHINRILKKQDNLKIIKSFTSDTGLSEFILENNCDIIFTDIELGSKNSIDLFKKIKNNLPQIVFMSTYPKYAHKSFAVNPLHYIVKPVTNSEVLTAIERFLNQNKDNIRESFFVKKLHSSNEKIYLDDILFIESEKDAIKIKTKENEIVTLSSIKKILEKLPNKFIRVHRSFIININHIKSFENKNIKIDDYTIPISRAYKKEVLQFIHQLSK